MSDASEQNLIGRIAREPTVHFLLLAGLLFAIYRFTHPDPLIELPIDWQEIEARILIAELNAREPLSEEQKRSLQQSVIDDYVLVYEARSMGLDNDPQINDILVQKMRHVLSGSLAQPDAEQLDTYYRDNLERYRIPARLTLEELVFATRDPLPDDLDRRLQSGLPADTLQTELLYTDSSLPRVTRADLASIFSPEFADRVFTATDSRWLGPFISNRGQHFLKIVDRFPEQQLGVDDVRDQLQADWLSDKEEAHLATAIAGLRDRYNIVLLNRPEP